MSIIEFLDKNFEVWQFWREEKNTNRLVYRNGELISKTRTNSSGIAARVNGIYYFSTNQGEDKLKEIINPGKEVSNIKLSNSKGEYITRYDVDLEEVAKEINYFLKDKNVIYELLVFKTERDYEFLNSNGARVHQKLIYNGWYLTLIKKSFGKSAELHIRSLSCLYPVKPNFEEIQEKLDILDKLVNAKMIKPQTTNLVLDPEITDLLIHEAYGHALERDLIELNDSVFSDKRPFLGEEITMYENPLESIWGFYKYDDEGFPAKKKILIENGEIKGFIEDGRYGEGGWGRKENIHHPPIPRMACTVLEPGNYSKEELIEEAKNGYLLCGFSGGQVDTKKGDFMFKSSYAFYIKNGEISDIYKGVAFGGNILTIGKKISMRSKDIIESYGGCGKNGQHVPVSSKCPYILIENVKL